MKKIKYSINTLLLSFVLLFTGVSCTSLDIPPMNIVTDDYILTTKSGIDSYMVTMYRLLPMEDFTYNAEWGMWANRFHSSPATYAGEAIATATGGCVYEKINYWDEPYKLIRYANYFIENIGRFAHLYAEDEVNAWKGEAYFVRAFTYAALAKRYGGVPIVDKVINYPSDASLEDTQLHRDSEEATWDFVSKSLDEAIKLLPEKSMMRGRANKYVAAAYKSRAMLFAGSIAKYNKNVMNEGDKQLCGIPSSRAKDYFQQAYDASKLVDAGGYKLYKDEWKAGDKEAQYNNYVNLFLKPTCEDILVRDFHYPENGHSWDCCAQPRQTATGDCNSGVCVTLDFVEMFDGFAKDAHGHFENFDQNGHYKLFNSTYEPFQNCEPRLRAMVILPGDSFKNQSIEIRRGVYIGEEEGGIERLIPEGTEGSYDVYPGIEKKLALAVNEEQNNRDDYKITLGNGEVVKRFGQSGTCAQTKFGTNVSGFSVRKYLDPTLSHTDWWRSNTSWKEIRYAEVLLNRAEAAMELGNAGEAYNLVNQIRERAGAELLKSQSEVNIDVVRKERRKELAFENQTYWDLRRWRILDKEQNNRVYNTLMPFLTKESAKYFFDIKSMESPARYTYDTRWYYQQIPWSEIEKNPNMKQNPGF